VKEVESSSSPRSVPVVWKVQSESQSQLESGPYQLESTSQSSIGVSGLRSAGIFASERSYRWATVESVVSVGKG
jgi:hypothetical protein